MTGTTLKTTTPTSSLNKRPDFAVDVDVDDIGDGVPVRPLRPNEVTLLLDECDGMLAELEAMSAPHSTTHTRTESASTTCSESNASSSFFIHQHSVKNFHSCSS